MLFVDCLLFNVCMLFPEKLLGERNSVGRLALAGLALVL
jgi:hypothetical protein